MQKPLQKFTEFCKKFIKSVILWSFVNFWQISRKIRKRVQILKSQNRKVNDLYNKEFTIFR